MNASELRTPPCSVCGRDPRGLATMRLVHGKPVWTCEGCGPAVRTESYEVFADGTRSVTVAWSGAAGHHRDCPGDRGRHSQSCGADGRGPCVEPPRPRMATRPGFTPSWKEPGPGASDLDRMEHRRLVDADRAQFDAGIRHEIGDAAFAARQACEVCSGRSGAGCTCTVWCGDCRCETPDPRLTVAYERGRADERASLDAAAQVHEPCLFAVVDKLRELATAPEPVVDAAEVEGQPVSVPTVAELLNAAAAWLAQHVECGAAGGDGRG